MSKFAPYPKYKQCIPTACTRRQNMCWRIHYSGSGNGWSAEWVYKPKYNPRHLPVVQDLKMVLFQEWYGWHHALLEHCEIQPCPVNHA
jgi:hypothetical protein